MTPRRALPNRRSVLASIAAAGAFAATGARAQSNWPDHPVRIIVPYPAGGSTDVLSRILAERMKEMFGQPFVIENRPGAGGNIGIAAVTGSPPDGYTIGAATIGHFAINQYLYSKMPYDAERDMVPASLTWELPNVFVVASDHCPAKTVSEFISWAKQRGRVSYGSPGVGTFAIDNLTSYVPAISSGKMRALAVTAAQRLPTMADVPTMEEAGMKNFVVTSWAAFVFPAGTPRPIIDKIAGAMKQIAADAEIQKRFQVGGALVLSSTPEGALAYAAKERTLWKDVVAASGAKI